MKDYIAIKTHATKTYLEKCPLHMLNEKMKHITAIHIFNSYSLSAYYMPGIVLDTGNILCPHGAYHYSKFCIYTNLSMCVCAQLLQLCLFVTLWTEPAKLLCP